MTNLKCTPSPRKRVEFQVESDYYFICSKLRNSGEGSSRKAIVHFTISTQQKIIKKIDGLEETSHFDRNICPHHHFFCKKCKRIFDINLDIIPNKIDEFLQKDGLNVEEYEVSFRGICANCQNKI